MESNTTSTGAPPGRDAATRLYRTMVLARRIEERLIRLYHQGGLTGGVYTSIGHEAIGASVAAVAAPQDLFAPLIRDLTLHLGRGMTALEAMRHWMAKANGPMRGRDGNVHVGDLGRGIFPMISHLGAMLPVLVGGVMARRQKSVEAVGVGFIGDGGTSTGDFHEAVNFAAVRRVPVLFIIENNKYAYSTPTALQYRCKNLIDRAPGYGIEGYSADGNDALALYRLIGGLMADLRANPRAVLLECETMRMRGHGEHDDFSYVPRELLAAYQARDPIAGIRGRLLADGVLSEQELAAIEATCAEEVDKAYQQAQTEPGPSPASLLEGVYAAG